MSRIDWANVFAISTLVAVIIALWAAVTLAVYLVLEILRGAA